MVFTNDCSFEEIIAVSKFKEMLDDSFEEEEYYAEKGFGNGEEFILASVSEAKFLNGRKVFHNKQERWIKLILRGSDKISVEIEDFLPKTFATFKGKLQEDLRIFECTDGINCFQFKPEFEEDYFVEFEYLSYSNLNTETGCVFFGTMDYYMSELFK